MASNVSSDNFKMSSSTKTSTKAAKTAATPSTAAVAAVTVPVAETKTKGKKAAAAAATAAPVSSVTVPVVDVAAVVATASAPVASTPVVEEDVATKLTNAIKRQAEIAHQQKALASESAALVKEIEKLAARLAKKAAGRKRRAPLAEGATSNNGKAFITPVPITNDLAAFLGLEKGALISRRDVSKRIYAYAKSHNLQKGKVINTDASLRKLLGVTEKDEVNILNLQKYINKHYIKATPAAAPTPVAN